MKLRENGRRQWNKKVNMLFNKVLGENEKGVFYFSLILKNQRNFLANAITQCGNQSPILGSLDCNHYAALVEN